MLTHCRMILSVLVLGFSMNPAPAVAGAKITFSQYEGPPIVETGSGGTKIQKNGVDYWTTGTPPRRYQVIGVIQDKRDETWDGGHAIGSPTVAKRAKAAGGDAVIVQMQDETGNTGGGGLAGLWGGVFAMGGSKTITSMLVVRYLPDEQSLDVPQSDKSPEAPEATQDSPSASQGE